MPSGENQKKKLMYDLYYVKKRRRRKIAAFVSLISSIGIASFVITSFLGPKVGSFSVTVANTDVKLSLSETENYDIDNTVAYLRVDELYPFVESHYKDLPSDDILDNELTPYDDPRALGYDGNGKVECMYYLKYTFYVINTGKRTAHYDLTVNLTDHTKSSDGTERMIDDTVRVRVYENDPSTGEHSSKTYAKEAAGNNRKKDGTITRQEFIGYNGVGDYESDEHPLAETFTSNSVVAHYEVGDFKRSEIKRYTLVFWLEGEDPQSNASDEPPEDAKIKFGVEIKAYEEI